MSRFILDRRTFLRGVLGGAAISIPLPPLEAMFDASGTALAQGRPIPKRFGVWFWGNGVRRQHWIPDGAGTSWREKAEMEPLTTPPGLKAYVSPVTGLEIKTATHPHHSGMSGMLSGSRYFQVGTTRDTIVSTFAQPSIDQVVAERWAQDPMTRAPFRSIEVGVCRFWGTDEGTSFQHLSHNGPNNVNASEYNAKRLFDRLFGMPLPQQAQVARATILDAVKGDLDALKRRVSRADRTRLDQHTDSIRSIEQRLAASAGACATPAEPNADYPDVEGREQIEQKNQVMSDLLVTALACDLTRVFSVQFSTCGAGTIFWMANARNGLHQTCHDERAMGSEQQPTVHGATVFTMSQLAYFLDKLRSVREGAGNLLDSCAILCTTELSEGYTHSNDEFPILVAGKAGGALRGGVHYRSPNKGNTSMVLLTLLRAIGDPRPSFGTAAGETSQVITELMS